jgi:hypothetical protein
MLSFADPIYYPVKQSILADYLTYSFLWVCPHCWATPITKTFNLLEHRFPQVPVRQWVVTMPKRLRYILLSDSQLTGRVLEIGLRVVIERTLREHCPDASLTENTAASLISIVSAQRVMPICCACLFDAAC